MMISMDDAEHSRRRKLVSRGFTPRRVRDHEQTIRRICTEIIDRVAPKGECDFVWDIAAPLPLLLIADMLGFPPESYDDLLRWSDDLIRGTTVGDPEAMRGRRPTRCSRSASSSSASSPTAGRSRRRTTSSASSATPRSTASGSTTSRSSRRAC